jgi:hypothetical protein
LPTLYDYRISQITPAILLLMAFGLANFRREVTLFFVAVIVVYGVFSVDVYRPKEPWREFGQMVAEFAQSGDAVLLEFTGGDYTMDYYLERYLAAGIPSVSMWQWRSFEPETYESGVLGYIDSHDTIWLGRWSSSEEAFIKLRATNHIPTMRRTIQHFDNEFELYRFDRPPQETIAHFENGMVLNRVEIDAGWVELLWSTDTVLSFDYTVSVKLLDEAGQIMAQIDRQPQLDMRPTSTWTTEEFIYDPYIFEIEADTIFIQVYHWSPEDIAPVLTDTGENGLSLHAQ